MSKIIIKIIRYIFLLSVIFIMLNLIKNIYLRNYYKIGSKCMVKIEGEKNSLIGTWKGTFDSIEESIDSRLVYEYNFFNDSTGILKYKIYCTKIGGLCAKPYSWLSLLPYSESNKYVDTLKLNFDNNYITYFPSEDPLNSFVVVTLYQKYKIENDLLYLDQHWKNYKYKDKPIWDESYLYKIKYSEILFWGLFSFKTAN